MWKCAFCGAMNEDESLVCDGCGDERPNSSAASEPVVPNFDKREDFEDMRASSPPSTPTTKFAQHDDEEEEDASLQGKDDDDSEKDEPLEANDNDNDDDSDTQADSETEPFGKSFSSPALDDNDDDAASGSSGSGSDFSSDVVISNPVSSSSSAPSTSSFDEPEPVTSSYSPPSPTPSAQPAYSTSSFSSSSTVGQRYFLVFVNTPAQALIKSRVSVDFDDFPVISIGRNPENIVVIPDQEVSRKHAELAIENGKLLLKDLKSANGTYLYDGKQFNRVNGSVEVKPNSILKFGTGTIVRLENG